MKTGFSQLGFKIEATADGSPTLRLSEEGEPMHHSGGAAKETNYIYADPLRASLAQMPEASTCVVGLGLAYIEIAWALCEPTKGATLTSFEIVEPLRKNFDDWLNSEDPDIYDDVAKTLQTNADIPKLKNRLRQNFLAEPIRSDARGELARSWNLICYDAFSKKSSSDLWDEVFLNGFIEQACAPDCVFITYACTGILKKTLKRHGFVTVDRLGFPGKKNCTLALRGSFTSGSVSRIS